jgi:hypothetical protein
MTLVSFSATMMALWTVRTVKFRIKNVTSVSSMMSLTQGRVFWPPRRIPPRKHLFSRQSCYVFFCATTQQDGKYISKQKIFKGQFGSIFEISGSPIGRNGNMSGLVC